MLKDIIRDINKRCRLAMNGVVSTSMRKWGLDYKVNFGLTIQQIKDISKNYTPDVSLAEDIWHRNTRELKIMATMLYPVDLFTEEVANKWVTEIPNQEIREQICFNLFQESTYAKSIATEWVKDPDVSVRATGYWLLARLLLLKRIDSIHLESLPHIWDDIISDDISLRNAALSALKYSGRQSKESANAILNKIASFQHSERPLEQEIYNSLDFEFGYL